MRRHLEHTIEDEATTSEEAITPVPPVILDDMVGLCLNPPIERNQREAGHPARDVDSLGETVGNAEARKGKHTVRDEIAVGDAPVSLDEGK